MDGNPERMILARRRRERPSYGGRGSGHQPAAPASSVGISTRTYSTCRTLTASAGRLSPFPPAAPKRTRARRPPRLGIQDQKKRLVFVPGAIELDRVPEDGGYGIVLHDLVGASAHQSAARGPSARRYP